VESVTTCQDADDDSFDQYSSKRKNPRMKDDEEIVTSDTSQDGSHGSGTDNEEFFDASDNNFMDFAHVKPVEVFQQPRRGARCPVQDASLMETGEQLYAPYLRRPYPLTDDVIAERRLMLTRQGDDERKSSTIQQQLEIVHRILKPKLFSDMQSFKAANPCSTFHDFVTWYGNPADLLACCDEELMHHGCGDGNNMSNICSITESIGSVSQSIEMKRDKSAESIQAFGKTRELWSSAWDEALPIPAIEQGPLFNAENIVEMALDYLENIHPASLLCQVAAVNLSSAYFALLVSAGETVLYIPTASLTMLHLREKIETALYLLSVDATKATGTLHDKKEKSDQFMMTSIEALAACSSACDALGQAEVIIARAASLVHKLKNEKNLIESILRNVEGLPIQVPCQSTQKALLDTIYTRQKEIPAMDQESKPNKSSTWTLKPAIREYMLRNMDNNMPCQLSVRYSDEGIKVSNLSGQHGSDSTRPFENGILLALSLTSREF
jgi:Rab3 GTPase-activating protein catalytic subunit